MHQSHRNKQLILHRTDRVSTVSMVSRHRIMDRVSVNVSVGPVCRCISYPHPLQSAL